MNLDHEAEHREILARCAVCQVERCADCDTVHLRVGHASPRLTMAAFLSLCATLIEAAPVSTPGTIMPVPPRRAAN